MAGSVLVVDDDSGFCKLVSRLLAARGLTVVGQAESVSAALSAAARLRPSAVLVDAELPDGDGIELSRQLAALPWRPRIVLTSTESDIVTAENARLAGAQAFLNKVELASAPLAELLGNE